MTENIQHYNLTFHLYDSLGEKPVQHERIEIRRRLDVPAEENCTLTTHVVTKRTDANGYLQLSLPSTEIKDTELVAIPYLLTVGNKPEIAFTLEQDIDYNDILTDLVEGGTLAVPLSTRKKLERDLSNPSADSTQIDYFRNYLKAIAATEVAEWAKTVNTTTFLPVSQIPILGTGKIADKAITLTKIAKGTPGRFVGFDLSGNATELTPPTADGEPVPVQAGSSTFVGLSDTPSAFTGNAGGFARVNATEDAVEFSGILVDDIPDLDASKVASGTFDVARLPDIDASKVTGTLATARIPNLNASKINAGVFALDRIPNLDAAKITSGTFDAARLSDIDASKVASGTFDAARIPDLAASKIMSGVFALDRIPNLDAARIPDIDASKVTGTLATARIPNLDASKINAGVFALDRIPNLDADKIPNLDASKINTGEFALDRIPNLDTAKITSGTFDVARIPDIAASKITSGTFGTDRFTDRSVTLAKLTTGTANKVIGFDNSGNPAELDQSGPAQELSFEASFQNVSSQSITATFTAFAEIQNTDINVNNGSFAVNTTSGITRITIPKNGRYIVNASLYFENGSAQRLHPDVQLARTRSSTTTRVGPVGTSYLRNNGDSNESVSTIVTILDLEENDTLELQVSSSSTIGTANLTGNKSSISIVGIALPAQTIQTSGASNFLELDDSPSFYTASRFVKSNSSGNALEFGTLAVADIPNLAASKITSGTFGIARLPNLDANKIASGTFDAARIPDLAASKITSGEFALDRIPNLTENKIPNLNASKINAGTFNVARIPDIDASKIATGTFDVARIPDLDADKITSGTFDDARIPDLAASKITSGEFDAARIPNLNASKINAGVFALDRIPNLDAARIPNLNASKINAGVFALDRIPNLDTARIPNLNASKINAGTFDGARIPNLSANKITSGTFDAARLPDLAASKITSGTFDAARLASGGTDDQVLTRTVSGMAWEDAPESGVQSDNLTHMTGLTQAEYNAIPMAERTDDKIYFIA